MTDPSESFPESIGAPDAELNQMFSTILSANIGSYVIGNVTLHLKQYRDDTVGAVFEEVCTLETQEPYIIYAEYAVTTDGDIEKDVDMQPISQRVIEDAEKFLVELEHNRAQVIQLTEAISEEAAYGKLLDEKLHGPNRLSNVQRLLDYLRDQEQEDSLGVHHVSGSDLYTTIERIREFLYYPQA